MAPCGVVRVCEEDAYDPRLTTRPKSELSMFCLKRTSEQRLGEVCALRDSAPLAVVVKTVLGSHFGAGAPPVLEPILLGIGMFTEGTIWILTRGQFYWNTLGGSEAWLPVHRAETRKEANLIG